MPKESRLPGEGNAQRLKMLYLRDIFLKYTNENQSLTRQQIEEKLADLGVSEGRKAFAEDIEALRQYGMDIQSTNGRTASYQLMSRDFELAELKLIADVISSSKFLTYNQSAELLHKIEDLCCDCDAMQLRRNVFVTGRSRQPNKGVLYNVDTIQRSIAGENGKFKISFKYFEYDMNRRKKYRDKARICTPYALVWDRDHYYLVAWNDHRECYSNFRVDRMEAVRITAEPARPLDRDFDLTQYVMTHISMFSGDEGRGTFHALRQRGGRGAVLCVAVPVRRKGCGAVPGVGPPEIHRHAQGRDGKCVNTHTACQTGVDDADVPLSTI